MINIKIAKSVKCNDDYALFIMFNFKREIVDTIKSLCPTRYYNKDKKEWEVPYERLDIITKHLGEIDRIHFIEEAKPDVKEHIDLPSDFQYKTKPYDYQSVGIDYGLNNEKWLLGDEQGLGKTKQVIDVAVARKKLYGYKHCLIVCGVNSLKWNWVNEIHTHSNEQAFILGQRTKKNKIVVGGNADKLADVLRLHENALDCYFIITNIETMRNAEIVENLRSLCVSKTISMIAVDELHKCFDYDTPIFTTKGYIKIGDIVTHKLDVLVASYNESTQQIEFKPVISRFQNAVRTKMLTLEIETSKGIKTIKCTKNHKFFTNNRGWVEAQNLTSEDDILELALQIYT